MKKTSVFCAILVLALTSAYTQAQDPVVTPGPMAPEAQVAQPEGKPTEVKLDKAQRQALKAQKQAERQALKEKKLAEKKAQKEAAKKAQEEKKVQAEKKAQPEKQPKEKAHAKMRPEKNFHRELDPRVLGDLKQAFQTHPEFKKVIEEEIALEKQCREAVKKVKNEKDPVKKAEAEKELREIVGKHFTVRQTRRVFELKLLEERLKEINSQIEKRNGNKERIVDKRMMELIGTEEDLRF